MVKTCLFLEDSNFQPMWRMIKLSNMPKAVARQAPPKRRPCVPYCHGFKEMVLSFLCTSSRPSVLDNFSFINFIPFLVWRFFERDLIVRFS